MKVLIVSNAYPSREKKYSGIFVKNQYEELKSILESEDVLEIFYMRRQLTSKFGTILKYFKAFLHFIPFLFRKYDVVHLHFFHPLIYFVWLYKKLHTTTKIVVTFHGSDINNKVNKNNVNRFREISKCIDFTIPVGNELAYAIRSKLSLEIGKVLPAGVDSKIFFKNNFFIKKSYDYMFVGSFLPVKGIDILLEVIEKSPRNVSFCIVGKGKLYEDKINELIAKGYNITLKIDQSQQELSKLYNSSRFLVQPSRSEGFGLVVAEGMFCGLPAIVSNIGGFRDQVIHGKNGFLFEVGNVRQLLDQIVYLQSLSKENYDALSKNAIKTSEMLSLQNVCKELKDIYKNLSF